VRRPGSWKRLASPLVLVIAGTAALATSPPPPPTLHDAANDEVVLDGDHPVAARRITVTLAPGQERVSYSAGLRVARGAEGDADWRGLATREVAVAYSVQTGPVAGSENYGNDQATGYTWFELPEGCMSEGCTFTVDLVFALRDPDATAEIPWHASLDVSFEGSGGASPPANAALTVDIVDLGSQDDGTVLARSVDGAIEVGNDHVQSDLQGVLVRADSLGVDTDDWLGLVAFDVDSVVHRVVAEFDAQTETAIWMAADSGLAEVRLWWTNIFDSGGAQSPMLVFCDGKSPCDATFAIEALWEPGFQAPDAGHVGSATVNWTLSAYLIWAGDGPRPPEPTFTVELAPAPPQDQ
jgi:hypothetical protein